jgi:ketosteroid isomerase-like protein
VRDLVGGASPAATTVAAAKPPVTVAAAPATPAREPAREPVKPPVAVAAVEAKSPAAEKAPAGGNAEVVETVRAWAKAWSARDVEAYLAFYGKDFKTPGGEPRAAWEKTRRQRIGAPKSIAVTIESPKVSVAANGQASVTFRQSYRSDVLKATTTTKTLVLARSDGRWLIQQERVGN